MKNYQFIIFLQPDTIKHSVRFDEKIYTFPVSGQFAYKFKYDKTYEYVI